MSTTHPEPAKTPVTEERDSALARMALRFTAFTEKWLPDAFGFVLVGTILIFILALATGNPVFGMGKNKSGMGVVDAWGAGFWSLVTFTLQMAMIIIGGYAVAVSAPMSKVIVAMAKWPRSPRGAIVFVAAVAMITSYLNWAFSLIFTAVLAKEVARLNPRADYRALGAMAFLGLGTVWAQGLSGSAALQVASASSSPKQVTDVIKASGNPDYANGIIPLSGTIFTWRAIVATLVVFSMALIMAFLIAPRGAKAKGAADLGIDIKPLIGPGSEYQMSRDAERATVRRKGDWIEGTPWMSIVIVLLATVSIARMFGASSNWIVALDLNMVNLILLMVAMILHWHPARLVRAVTDGTKAAAGVLLQFPFYGGIFGMIAYTGLSHTIAGWLTSIANQFFYPGLIAIYSMVLGVFVPSGGSKWVIEAPYVIEAGNHLHVDPGWMVIVYDLGEASANLLQPFWMLPTLAVLGLKARDIMGYTFSMFLACFPAALIAVTFLAPHI